MGASLDIAVTQVPELIYDSCLALNAEDWDAFLGLCDEKSFTYSIVNYSPEIRREQCWMEKDYRGLKSMFDLLPRHNSDRSPLTRHATVYRVDHDRDRREARAVTQLAIYRTQLDGINSHFESGATSLFAVGRYEDLIDLGGERPILKTRVVRLDTRQIDIGSHLPF